MRSFKYCIMILFTALTIGCATVTPEASKVMTIRDGAVAAMMDCKQLGFVVGDAGVWGGVAGMETAMINAKNEVAKIHGANAMMVTNSRMNPTSIVNATAYNCSSRSPQKVEVVNSAPVAVDKPAPKDMFAKAKKCQELGGVWYNDQCVVEIE